MPETAVRGAVPSGATLLDPRSLHLALLLIYIGTRRSPPSRARKPAIVVPAAPLASQPVEQARPCACLLCHSIYSMNWRGRALCWPSDCKTRACGAACIDAPSVSHVGQHLAASRSITKHHLGTATSRGAAACFTPSAAASQRTHTITLTSIYM